MPIFVHRSPLDFPPDVVFAWHSRDGAFERLSPSWQNVRVVEKIGGIEDGSQLTIEIRQGPARVRWIARHKNYQEGQQFVDEQVRGPFAAWEHTHRFLPHADGQSILEDSVIYKLPLHPLSQWVGGWMAKRQFKRLFRFRHMRTQNDLKRHRDYADNPRQTVAITGASGMIGTALGGFLSTGGHKVKRLVRKKTAVGTHEVYWNPSTGEVDSVGLQGVDTVVHLAAENIGNGRWSAAYKDKIRRSRVEGTRVLCEALAKMENPPRTLICASAIGFYGDRAAELLTEEHPVGDGFLAEVVQAWEEAVAPAVQAGIRVVLLRIGVVLGRKGGALKKMLLPFSLGVGGKVGGGNQYMSWVSLDDTIGAIYHAMFTENLSGAVNVVAPQAVTNAEFTRKFGKVIGRPTIFPIPALAIRLLFGEMGEETLLKSQRVSSQKLVASGFEFLYSDLESALRAELGLLK